MDYTSLKGKHLPVDRT